MLEILKYTLPSLLVFLATYLVMTKQMRYETLKQTFELKKAQSKDLLPARLRGYERLALLLDRTQPEHMIMNIDITRMNCIELQTKLLSTIRQEFDHNASQQIYVSFTTWESIKASKESLLQLVNTCADNVNHTDPAFALAEHIIKTFNYTPDIPSRKAIEELKSEVRKLF